MILYMIQGKDLVKERVLCPSSDYYSQVTCNYGQENIIFNHRWCKNKFIKFFLEQNFMSFQKLVLISVFLVNWWSNCVSNFFKVTDQFLTMNQNHAFNLYSKAWIKLPLLKKLLSSFHITTRKFTEVHHLLSNKVHQLAL